MISSSATTTTAILFTIALFLITSSLSSFVHDDDVQCLVDFHSSVSFSADESQLSWNFANTSAGSVCSFTGVSCWNPQENYVQNLSLSFSSLSGSISDVLSALSQCSSIVNLDLSSNSFDGSIPSSLCSTLLPFPYLVTLNLSYNSLVGPIPALLANCSHLTDLDLSNNKLAGLVPSELSVFDASSFDHNPSLCGSLLSLDCNFILTTRKILIFFASGFSGFISSISISFLVWRFFFFEPNSASHKEKEDQLTSPYSNRLNLARLSKNSIEILSLRELRIATRDFHHSNIVVAGSSSTGTSYEAVLPDGSWLIVKRLFDCRLSGRQFRTEMGWIKQIRHPNLVPFLGVCTSMEERFAMYEAMFNGALSSLLQSKDEILDWERRLRIGIGVARGLAWLHHGYQVPLLHRNLCSSAVLLDECYEPRIADFGLTGRSRPSVVDGGVSTCASSSAAPDYASLPSTRVDVYDLGVVLLELATGQCVLDVNSDDLVHRATHALSEAIDISLKGKGNDDEIVEFLKIACGCVVDCPHESPSAIEVYKSLKSIGGGHEISEDSDESSLIYGSDNLDVAEVVKLAYCIYMRKDPFL